MRVYLVGGAVRDQLLGRPVHDRDWVVVGSTPEAMVAQGFRPVGRDFPVFLHPETREEYALARTERKTGAGYRGFDCHASPNVTLSQDLMRRDFTINAMAIGPQGQVTDPFGGQQDLANGVLRHVSDAFVEDPLRLVRGARFAAQLGFRVHEKTVALMRTMVQQGELASLAPERVWQETQKAMEAPYPERFIEVLDLVNAWEPWWGPWAAHAQALHAQALHAQAPHAQAHLMDGHSAQALERWAVLHACLDAAEVKDWHARLRVPKHWSWLGVFMACWGKVWLNDPPISAEAIIVWLDRLDAWRQPERAKVVLRSFELINGGSVQCPAWLHHPEALLAALLAVRLEGGCLKSVPCPERSRLLRERRLVRLKDYLLEK